MKTSVEHKNHIADRYAQYEHLYKGKKCSQYYKFFMAIYSQRERREKNDIQYRYIGNFIYIRNISFLYIFLSKVAIKC